MRRFNVIALIAVVVVALFAVNAFAQDSALKVIEKAGQVLVKAAGTTEFVEVDIGQSLNPRDVIKTGDIGQARLEFPGRSGFTLKPNTEITIDELVWSNVAKKVGVSMKVGKMKTLINQLDSPSEFTVKTPSAICGARGTIWFTEVSLTGETVILNTENSTSFGNLNGSTTYAVTQGNTSSASSNGTITPPTGAPQSLIAGMTSGYTVGLIAEPYSEPTGGANRGSYDFEAPEITLEETASPTT